MSYKGTQRRAPRFVPPPRPGVPPGWKDAAGKPMYHLEIGAGGSWRIGYGASSFLIAECGGFSRPVGTKLLHRLRSQSL